MEKVLLKRPTQALTVFESYKESELSLEDIFEKIHVKLNKTRGAAGALARFNFRENTMNYIGLGNISSMLLSNNKMKTLISMNGIVGHGNPKFQVLSYPLPEYFIFFMYSDGLLTHWDLEKYPGLLLKPSPLIAAVLYRDYKRKRDDSTIVVIKKYPLYSGPH